MFQNIGFTEILLIAIVALVLFGPQKLPEIGRVLGRTIRDFKKGAHALLNDEPQAPAELKPAAPVTPIPQPQAQSSTASTGAVETAAATRAAVEFVTATPAVVESAIAADTTDGLEAGSAITIEKGASTSIKPSSEFTAVRESNQTEQTADSPADPATSTIPPVSPAPPAAAPKAPSSTRRLPD